METNKSLTIENPNSISFDVTETEITVIFDGDKSLVIPVETHSMYDVFEEMINPTYAELCDEWEQFKTDKERLQHAYNNACNECEAAEKNYKKVLIGDALGNNIGSDKNDAMTLQTNARNHVHELSQAIGNFRFNSKYTAEQIKQSYEAAQTKLIEHYEAKEKYVAKNLAPLIGLIASQANTFNNALTQAAHVMTHDIYFKRGYERNFTAHVVGSVPMK